MFERVLATSEQKALAGRVARELQFSEVIVPVPEVGTRWELTPVDNDGGRCRCITTTIVIRAYREHHDENFIHDDGTMEVTPPGTVGIVFWQESFGERATGRLEGIRSDIWAHWLSKGIAKRVDKAPICKAC